MKPPCSAVCRLPTPAIRYSRRGRRSQSSLLIAGRRRSSWTISLIIAPASRNPGRSRNRFSAAVRGRSDFKWNIGSDNGRHLSGGYSHHAEDCPRNECVGAARRAGAEVLAELILSIGVPVALLRDLEG